MNINTKYFVLILFELKENCVNIYIIDGKGACLTRQAPFRLLHKTSIILKQLARSDLQ
jgi:hypothetical protein